MPDAPASPLSVPPADAAEAGDSRFAPGPERFQVAGIVGLVLPGLGHVLLGQPRRAVAIAMGVLGLFFGGLLLGGIDTVDSREDRLWFYVHAFVGPLAFGADWVNQNQFKAWSMDPNVAGRLEPTFRSAYPGEVRVSADQGNGLPHPQLVEMPQWGDANLYQGKAGAGKSVGKVNEVALLMCALAGMLNLVAVLDALFNRRRPEAELYGAGGGLVMVQLLAWRPFIDPIDAHAWWFMLLLPIAFLVSLAWKAVRVDDIKRLPRPVIVMTVQVILAMLGLGLAAFLGLVVVLPILMDLAR